MCTTSGRSPAAASPTAMPVQLFSEFGTSTTRAPPKRSKAAFVVPNVPLWSSTPSPSTITDGSEAMHWTVASLTASW
ncbi:hypothetical protein FrEUN1fDRAFT_4122 [Parafrankia sp. EUN1f]|nr:hypothetical protein [Parafrankia sp. EUN1f]EFC82775.1 hypothetical protein FrEUN1fDRAFT_4122 [Parafrankia sp. EUN1f]